jgi:hypothetical protein
MDFQLTDEQKLLKRTLREFAQKELRPRAARWDETGEYPWENSTRRRGAGSTIKGRARSLTGRILMREPPLPGRPVVDPSLGGSSGVASADS